MSTKKYSSIDNSPTKQSYSFSKAPRFPKIRANTMKFYDIPQKTCKRAPSFGYGIRYDFAPKKENITPAPYNCNYVIGSNHPYAPKYSFGLGRELMKKDYDQKFPGPGRYDYVVNTIGNEGVKYSMKGKYGDLYARNSFSPGPALYSPLLKINPEGVFPDSKFKNVQSVDFSKAGARFREKLEITPGPADYKKAGLFGNIFNSQFKSTHGKPIEGRYKQFSFEINNNPGPGAYECYGDFNTRRFKKNEVGSDGEVSVKSRDNSDSKNKSRINSGKDGNKDKENLNKVDSKVS